MPRLRAGAGWQGAHGESAGHAKGEGSACCGAFDSHVVRLLGKRQVLAATTVLPLCNCPEDSQLLLHNG